MAKRYRIAVLGGEIEEKRQSRVITGFLRQARKNNMDVCVFSMYRKYQDTPERESGDSNIFRLFNPLSFDGIVIIKDSIQTNGLCQEIEKRIEEEFNGPVLVIDRESDYFPSVYEDDHAGMSALVAHLIEVHGYRDIAYISGKRWHPHAIKRLQGYCDTMRRFGIHVNEGMIFHGDFWYSSGEQALRKFRSEMRRLPEAVVCANDEMAIGFCEALEKEGLKVPDDIAVVGFDSTEEGMTGPKMLTSTILADEECGVYAADYIRDRLNGTKETAFMEKPKLLIGETCGCKRHDKEKGCMRRTTWMTERMAEGIHNVNNLMPDNLLIQTNLQGFLGTAYSYVYQLTEADSLFLCLAPQWCNADRDATVHVSNSGYPDKMICALRYNKSGLNGAAGTDELFETSILLPELEKEHDEPMTFFFSPMFYESECFGYIAISYGDKARSYDADYRLWTASLLRGFEALRRTMLTDALKKQLENSMLNKFNRNESKYELLSEEEKQDYELVGKILDENLLTYFFQPIVRASDGSIFSYEALMRSKTEKKISPLDIIKYAGIGGRLIDVEKATFLNVLTIIEAESERFGDAKIFINSIPGIRLKDEDFDTIKELLSRNSHRTVVELTEEAELEESELDALKDLFTRMKIQIAIDDYGTGYSNVSNLLRYMPNYVKIDRALLSGIESKPQKQHFVSEIIKFCRDNDIMSLAEGIETTEELRKVIHMGVDLIQGYYTAKPSAEIIPKINDMIRNEIRTYYQERLDGSDNRTFVAGSGNRISLSMLDKDGYTDILIGEENAAHKDIAIVGTPSFSTDLHIKILPGYNGVITLENAGFSNIKGRPCIELSDDCDVTLKLQGENTLKGNGILVPKSSRLTLIGEGNLAVNTRHPLFYGIGNVEDEENGEIIFDQDGVVRIRAMGQDGVCIGSGLGGQIKVKRGQYLLSVGGNRCVGIGAIEGDSRFEIGSCMMEIEVNAEQAVCVGTLNGSSGLYLSKTSLNLTSSGDFVSGIGTLNGTDSDVFLENSRVNISIRSDDSTCIGALKGKTELGINHTSGSLENAGNRALIFGGFEQVTRIEMDKADLKIDVHNDLGLDTCSKGDDFKIKGGRVRCMINGEPFEREIDFS